MNGRSFPDGKVNGVGSTDAAELASLVKRNMPPGLLLQLHYLSQEPSLIELAWQMALMPAAVRTRLQDFLAEIGNPSDIMAQRDANMLTLKAAASGRKQAPRARAAKTGKSGR